MATSFYFYDLETSGFQPKTARIMQFAGVRTDPHLIEVGPAFNSLIKLTPDILPDPDALLLTGIMPQDTLKSGLSEADFLAHFYKEIVRPNTIFVGYNNIRFDDEFMRYLNYRNFYDPYEWQWKNNCSRWDLLDLVRMTRALRPDGIKWPFNPDGKPTNRLEFLSSLNKLEHAEAHDALSDVKAAVSVARLIYSNQPKLFNFLLNIRAKARVAALVLSGQPFIYTSSHFSSDYLHTAAVVLLAQTGPDSALVYDLRFDPRPFAAMDGPELAAAWKTRDPEEVRLPVKTIKFNRCPALAPLSVLDQAAQDRLNLPMSLIEANRALLKDCQTELSQKMVDLVRELDKERTAEQLTLAYDPLTIDERMYDDFVPDADRRLLPKIRQTKPNDLIKCANKLTDDRLKLLLPLYQARNWPESLSMAESKAWQDHCRLVLNRGDKLSRRSIYFSRLDDLKQTEKNQQRIALIERLRAYGQSVAPEG